MCISSNWTSPDCVGVLLNLVGGILDLVGLACIIAAVMNDDLPFSTGAIIIAPNIALMVFWLCTAISSDMRKSLGCAIGTLVLFIGQFGCVIAVYL